MLARRGKLSLLNDFLLPPSVRWCRNPLFIEVDVVPLPYPIDLVAWLIWDHRAGAERFEKMRIKMRGRNCGLAKLYPHYTVPLVQLDENRARQGRPNMLAHVVFAGGDMSDYRHAPDIFVAGCVFYAPSFDIGQGLLLAEYPRDTNRKWWHAELRPRVFRPFIWRVPGPGEIERHGRDGGHACPELLAPYLQTGSRLAAQYTPGRKAQERQVPGADQGFEYKIVHTGVSKLSLMAA